jgi:O-antigen/teichoic acid export membrane protein
MNEKEAYRKTIKATSLFGSVQLFKIMIIVIKSKMLAVFIGPSGIGIISLLESTINLIRGFSSFGLDVSAVKHISSSYQAGDKTQYSRIISIYKKLLWLTGFIGLLTTLVLSSWLSKIVFETNENTYMFSLLSMMLLFSQLNIGQLAILQGLQKLNSLAKANVLAAAISLIIIIPLYYYLRIDAIIPALVSSSFIAVIISSFYVKKIPFEKINITIRNAIIEGNDMLAMGIIISLSTIISGSSTYLLRLFINNYGNISEVGLYFAGFSIINNYVGMIFTAMSTDYYPRLSSMINNKELFNKTINQQAEICLLVIAPFILIFLVFKDPLITLLYSDKFLSVKQMMQWAVIGLFFKSASWPIGFIFMAKSKPKQFFWNQLISSIYFLGFNLLGYYYWGLTGLGMSFIINYMLHLLQMIIVGKIYHEFNYKRDLYILLIIQFTLGIMCFSCVYFPFKYITGILLIIVSIWYSYRELDVRLGITEKLKQL